MSNINIRRIEANDAKALQALYSHEKAYTGTLQLPNPSLAVWETRSSNLPDNVYAYVALVNDDIVGNLGFAIATNPCRRHVADIGMAVRDDAQGQGIGNALMQTAVDLADNWLNIKRIELTAYTDNEPAIALYKKFGFEIEGEAKAFAFRNGEYVDAYHMARVKD